MKKKLISLIIALVMLFGLVKPAMAIDLTVTCDDTDCVMTPGNVALFDEGDVKPGDNYSQTITVINNGPEDCLLMMATSNENDPDGLSQVLFTTINDGVTDWLGTTVGGRASSDANLWDLFASGSLDLGTVAAGGTNIYNWLVSIDTSVGNEYQGRNLVFDFGLSFSCGEPTGLDPGLGITKTNDKGGFNLSAGDIVTYTVVITNNGSGEAYNVVLKDVQPTTEHFDYLENSGLLDGSPVTAIGSNPYYWPIGNIPPGGSRTLSYQMEILDGAIPGAHTNIAVAYGQDEDEETHFSDPASSTFIVGYGPGLSGSFSGQVLGAATQIGQVLGAATGSKTFWLILSLIMILMGISLKMLAKRRFSRILKDLLLIIGLVSLVMAGIVGSAKAAAEVVVAIVQLPEYLNRRDPEISYTALDVKGTGLSVHLEFKKEGGSWQDLGTYSEPSRKVSTGGKITGDGKYFFRATACASGVCETSETWTNIDVTAPPPPEGYRKEKVGVQSYKISWHNPDHDDVYKVYIYRSDQRDFDANDSTKVGEKSVSKNTDSEWTDPVVPDSSKEYYYVIRTVDRAGNGSDLVGETYGSVAGEAVEAPAGGAVAGQEAVSGQVLREERVGEDTFGTGEEIEIEEETEPEEEGQILGGEEDEGEVESAESRRPFNWLLVIAAAGLAVTGYWFFRPKAKK